MPFLLLLFLFFCWKPEINNPNPLLANGLNLAILFYAGFEAAFFNKFVMWRLVVWEMAVWNILALHLTVFDFWGLWNSVWVVMIRQSLHTNTGILFLVFFLVVVVGQETISQWDWFAFSVWKVALVFCCIKIDKTEWKCLTNLKAMASSVWLWKYSSLKGSDIG